MIKKIISYAVTVFAVTQLSPAAASVSLEEINSELQFAINSVRGTSADARVAVKEIHNLLLKLLDLANKVIDPWYAHARVEAEYEEFKKLGTLQRYSAFKRDELETMIFSHDKLKRKDAAIAYKKFIESKIEVYKKLVTL